MKKMVFGATIRLAVEEKNGIMKKVFAEAKVFSSDYDVYIWGFTEKEVVYFHNGEKTVVCNFKNKLERRKLYFSELKKFTIKERADVFYLRYATTDFYLLDILKAFKKNGIVNIIEVPTFPYYGEFKSTLKRRAIYFLDILLRGKLKKYTDRIVTYNFDYDKIFGVSTIKTMNGIDFDKITPVSKIEHDGINLLVVASMLFTHGYDRLLKGLVEYYNSQPRKKIQIYMIGDGQELEYYKKIVFGTKSAQFIHFTGNILGEELTSYFNIADLAIGSLGLHRIGLFNGSTLKNREYVARGLPIVYSTTDPLLEGKWFAYKIESSDANIDILDIINFYYSVYSKENVSKKIREETKVICDMKVTMSPVLDYLREKQ